MTAAQMASVAELMELARSMLDDLTRRVDRVAERLAERDDAPPVASARWAEVAAARQDLAEAGDRLNTITEQFPAAPAERADAASSAMVETASDLGARTSVSDVAHAEDLAEVADVAEISEPADDCADEELDYAAGL